MPSEPRPENVDSVYYEQADDSQSYGRVTENHVKLLKLIEEDLAEDYTILDVDTPKVMGGNEDEWADSFYGDSLEPAVIRVRTEDNKRYEYEILLVDGETKLFTQQDIDDPETPEPDTLLR